MAKEKSSKLPALPVILTASDLLDGDVVYYDGTGWSRVLAEAKIAEDEPAARALEELIDTSGDKVVGAYLVTCALDDAGHAVPAHYRETIRQSGPTIAFGGQG